jgi:Putative  PD-(D/E)XK family member, (DUF4420)
MELLGWERLSEHIQSQFPVLVPMGGTRGALIGCDPGTHRLFLRLPSEAGDLTTPSPYADLHVEARRDDGRPVIEVFTTTPHLFKEFHRFAELLTDEYEHSGLSASAAFASVVERWRELAVRRDLLSAEEQLGLSGELAVLAALIRHHGPAAVSAWTGRMTEATPERHDFRLGAIDLEVKSTRSARRQHLIHGLRQLDPSAGHQLFLVSIRFEAAGFANGVTLGMRVASIRALLSSNANATRQFDEKLVAARYRDADDTQYGDRTLLADTPTLIPVNENCPRLVASTIQGALGPALASRIAQDLTYRIDVEGLGKCLDACPEARSSGLLSLE